MEARPSFKAKGAPSGIGQQQFPRRPAACLNLKCPPVAPGVLVHYQDEKTVREHKLEVRAALRSVTASALTSRTNQCLETVIANVGSAVAERVICATTASRLKSPLVFATIYSAYSSTAAAAATAVFFLSVLGPGIKFDSLR
jgi:hypothetical protein